MREQTFINIPKEYKNNEKKGLCRVCGKKIERPFRKYCGAECSHKYQECFITWNMMRKKILMRDNHKCQICENTGNEVDHIHAITNGGEMWDENNLRTLCHKCHIKKTIADMKRKRAGGQAQTLLVD